MRMRATLATAAMLAAGCTAALAQAGPDTTSRPGMLQGADQNPTGPGADPTAGNPDGARNGRSGMTTAPVSGRSGAGPDAGNAGPRNPGDKSGGGR